HLRGIEPALPLSLSAIPGQAPPRRRDGRRGGPLPAGAGPGRWDGAALRAPAALLGHRLPLVPPLGAPLGGAAAGRGVVGAVGADSAVVSASIRWSCSVAVGISGDLGAVLP